jgi:hypothetical protein
MPKRIKKSDTKNEMKKRGRGRPQELADPVTTTIRIERKDLERLDRWAVQRSLSRSQAVGLLIEEHIEEHI